MKFSQFSCDTVAEVLTYLADHEEFSSIKPSKSLGKSEIKTIFYEIAAHLREESKNSPMLKRASLRQKEFTDQTHSVISKLTPQEEETLFKSFKIS
jgi:hypothetical protein